MATIYVIDDDDAVGESLRYLLHAEGYAVEHDHSAEECLNRQVWDRPACLVMDLRLSDTSGLDLLRQLRERGIHMPTIMISGRAEIPDAVRAVKEGVLDFLTKPFSDDDFLQRIRQAIELDQESLRKNAELLELRSRFDRLTSREREVMRCVLNGQANKQIAVELALSAKTVEFHRKHVMKKTGATTVTELMRLAAIVFPELRDLRRKPM
ncbi:response regulator [bacterium]|nr:response regulator [bacterium]